MGQDEANQKSAKIKELLVELCDAYNNPSSKSDRPMSGESNEVNNFLSGVMKDMEDVWEIVLEDSQENVLMHEVDKYLLDPIEKPSSRDMFNILEWWKLNNGKYHGLALVAKDVLAIQVSTVASESTFSTGIKVLDPYRSSLSPLLVEGLICYQNWIRSDSISNVQDVPTIENMEFYESVEEEQDKEDNVSGTAAASRAVDHLIPTTTKSPQASKLLETRASKASKGIKMKKGGKKTEK